MSEATKPTAPLIPIDTTPGTRKVIIGGEEWTWTHHPTILHAPKEVKDE